MLGVRVTVPIACFRKGLAREYLETERIPPPATCYGFLLSLVGETQRSRHVGCRVCPVVVTNDDPRMKTEISVVLRTVWRVKSRPLGSAGNTRPDYQQLLSPVEVVVWLDSTDEHEQTREKLEERVQRALAHPETIVRFGGLSLGESTHLVDEVSRFEGDSTRTGEAFLRSETGRLTLPVWVDHVGSAGTRYVTGDLKEIPLTTPEKVRMPKIELPAVD